MDYSKIYLHNAKKISDYYGNIYSPDVLNEIDVGDIVRISFIVKDHYLDDIWTHDSPYVLIIKKDENLDLDTDKNFVGEIYSHKRQQTDKYPISLGERILFSKNNIIEIPINLQQSSNVTYKFNNYLTDERITITGPLYTIEYDDSSEDESDTESENFYSGSESSAESYISDSE